MFLTISPRTSRTRPTGFLLGCLLLCVLILAGCPATEGAVPAAGPSTDVGADTVGSSTPIPALDTDPATMEASPTVVVQEPEAADDGASNSTIQFTIAASESSAYFRLDEELMGRPTEVVGISDGIAGSLTVAPTDPAASTVAPIVIDAGSFVTDNDRRNGAIRRFVLQSGSYPEIRFTPTLLEKMPDAIAVGDTVSFQMRGELQIREVVRTETFTVTIRVLSESELHGSAETTVRRSDYELTIPSVPSVANVSDTVHLGFDFVARAALDPLQ